MICDALILPSARIHPLCESFQVWVKDVITMQIMASYTGRRIDCWVVGEEVKRDSQLSIYKGERLALAST